MVNLWRLSFSYNYHIKIFVGAPLNWRVGQVRDPRARGVRVRVRLAVVRVSLAVVRVRVRLAVVRVRLADHVLANLTLARRVRQVHGDQV